MSRDDVEYELSVLQRKRDAKACMAHTARIMNGEIRSGTVGSFVGRAKNTQTRVKKDKADS
jgi:hypothetical protein